MRIIMMYMLVGIMTLTCMIVIPIIATPLKPYTNPEVKPKVQYTETYDPANLIPILIE